MAFVQLYKQNLDQPIVCSWCMVVRRPSPHSHMSGSLPTETTLTTDIIHTNTQHHVVHHRFCRRCCRGE
jgi:hypothetical protein